MSRDERQARFFG